MWPILVFKQLNSSEMRNFARILAKNWNRTPKSLFNGLQERQWKGVKVKRAPVSTRRP